MLKEVHKELDIKHEVFIDNKDCQEEYLKEILEEFVPQSREANIFITNAKNKKSYVLDSEI
jgi:hypothetical protein